MKKLIQKQDCLKEVLNILPHSRQPRFFLYRNHYLRKYHCNTVFFLKSFHSIIEIFNTCEVCEIQYCYWFNILFNSFRILLHNSIRCICRINDSFKKSIYKMFSKDNYAISYGFMSTPPRTLLAANSFAFTAFSNASIDLNTLPTEAMPDNRSLIFFSSSSSANDLLQ